MEPPQQPHGLHLGAEPMLPPAGPRRQEDPAADFWAMEEPGPPRHPPGPAQRQRSGTHDH